MTEERRLVALMLTDMAGFTRMSQQDEEHALRILELHNTTIVDSVAGHGGKVIKGTGDGFLVEFSSALQAASCAVDIQRQVYDRNRDCEEGDRFSVRIGLHVGDVVSKAGDIFGDGVNVLQRIEALADPGGVMSSAALRDLVWNKLREPFVSLGAKQLKNLVAPIEVYRIVLPWESENAPSLPTPDPSRLAVLPLANISPSPADEYFADGMTEELVFALSSVAGLRVIAQTSTLAYKGSPKPIREIARELGVGCVLEGSVRKAGEQLRITVQAIDATSEEHVWAGRYDRKLADVFEIQTEIAQSVAREIRGVLDRREAQRPTTNLDAYTEYLKGRQAFARRNRGSLYAALEHFNAAVGADPQFARAYTGIADTYVVLANQGHEAGTAVYPQARAAAEKAISLAPDLAEGHASLGLVLSSDAGHDTARAERALRRAIELNSNYAPAHHWLGNLLGYVGRDREALAEMETALELDPLAHILHVAYAERLLETSDPEGAKAHYLRARELDASYPIVAGELAFAEMVLWNWRGAEDALRDGLRRDPNNRWALVEQARLELLRGNAGAAREALATAERANRESPDVWMFGGTLDYYDGNAEAAIPLLERVVSARPDDPMSMGFLVRAHLVLGQIEEARRWLERIPSVVPLESHRVRLYHDALRGVVAGLEQDTKSLQEVLGALASQGEAPRSHVFAAVVLSTAGRREEAFDEIERALAVHDPSLLDLPLDPLAAAIRSDPRFPRVLEVMGLGPRAASQPID